MNKKCFCCFESINNDLNCKNDLMTDWLDFRSEELETNLSEEDKRHLLKFDVFADRILDATLDATLDSKKDYVSDVLDDLRDDFLQHCIYWNEKYYRTGFCDGIKLLNNTLNP